MKKYLLLTLFLVLSQLNLLKAQNLFNAPETVCVFQPVQLTSNLLNQNSYYWGFCSGYLMNTPTGSNLGNSFGFHSPGAIDVAKDVATGNYFGFVLNSETTELLRLNYGNSLNNIPTVTNFGNLTNGLPVNPTSIFMLRDTFSGNWYLFVSGGYTQATSQLARIDFGPTLSNPTPNIANFGNLWNKLNGPKGLFVAQDANNKWYGYLINHNTNELIRLEFSFNVSNTPLAYNMGNPSNTLNNPTDLAAIYDANNWYFFVTNQRSNSVVRVNIGSNLYPAAASIVGTDLGNFNFRINQPSSISLTKECGGLYAYITDSTTNQLIAIEMPAAIGPYTGIDYGLIGSMNLPSGISSIIRDHDNLFAFVCNAGDSTLTKIEIEQCHNSSIPSYTEVNPPTYFYDSPAVYNIYYVINEGMPNMQVQCKSITVLPIPPIIINTHFSMCQGDTSHIYAISTFADSIRWTSIYNIDTTFLAQDSVKVWPQYTSDYNVILYYPNGCVVDTYVHVNITNITADAGFDRTIADGSTTVLGGPITSEGNFSYNWHPYQFLSDSTVSNPYATPPYDFTYYLTVTELNDGLQCKKTDTVVVHLHCGDFEVPNAFAPSSNNPGTSKFGILNSELSRLAYFRIYDRWGVEVFETNDPSQWWDGTFNGQACPVGVYVWYADGFCGNGKRIKKQGNVTLLR